MPFAALGHRDFRIFWIGLTLSGAGSQFTTVAMAWQIYELTNSALQIGLLGLARAVPQAGLLLVGGLLADAVDRRRLMMWTQLGQLCVSAMLTVATAAGWVSPGFLYAATALLALFTALENPARNAIVPNLVPRVDLTNALALNSTQRQVSQLAGPSLAGVLIAASGPALCYGLDTGSWLVMLGSLVLMRARPQAAGGMRSISVGALREGIGFVWAHPVIFSMMALDFGMTLFGQPRALMPVYARDILQVGPEGLGLLYSASSAGAIAVAALMSMLGGVRRAGLLVLVGVGVFCVCTVLFGMSTVFWFSLLMLAGEGAGNTLGAVLRQTINQLSTPDELRGRVGSVNNIFTTSGPQFGQFRSGVVAELMGPQFSVVAGGFGALAVLAVIAVGVPAVRRFEITETMAAHEERGTESPRAGAQGGEHV